MDIINFGYYTSYAVEDDFDLNELRELTKVKLVGDRYIIDSDEDSNISIIIKKDVAYKKEEIEAITIKELKEDVEKYSKWWIEEQEKAKQINKELKKLKKQLGDFNANT